jgi:hypothetical protein
MSAAASIVGRGRTHCRWLCVTGGLSSAAAAGEGGAHARLDGWWVGGWWWWTCGGGEGAGCTSVWSSVEREQASKQHEGCVAQAT